MFLFSNYEQLIGLRYDTKFYGFVPDLSLNNPSKSIFIHCIFCNCFATGPLENWKIFNRNSNGMDFSLKISFLSSFPLLYCSCVAISWLLTNPGTVFIPNGTLPTFFNTRRMICFGKGKIVRQEAAATNTEGREWFSFICRKWIPTVQDDTTAGTWMARIWLTVPSDEEFYEALTTRLCIDAEVIRLLKCCPDPNREIRIAEAVLFRKLGAQPDCRE